MGKIGSEIFIPRYTRLRGDFVCVYLRVSVARFPLVNYAYHCNLCLCDLCHLVFSGVN